MEKKNMGHPGLEAAADAATLASGLALPPTKPSEILSAAADLIEPEGRWTQNRFAASADGEMRSPQEGEASCWCAWGALLRVAADPSDDAVYDASDIAEAVIGGNLVMFNDAPDRTQAEVVSALRQAAEKAREAGQ